MPLQNRVTPLGDLIATPERGLVFGNRGCLHNERGVIRRQYATKRWIACRLQFRVRKRPQLMAPGRYTELFFLDEATALAAGHRPCAECRRPDYDRFTAFWSELHPGQNRADPIDAQLHSERTGTGRFHQVPFSQLPDGVFVMHDGEPHVIVGQWLLAWSPGGYLEPRRRPANDHATVITPPSLVALVAGGWSPLVPLLHPTAHRASPGRRPR